MDDAQQFLRLATTRLNNLQRRDKSLKQLCLQFVTENFANINFSNVTLPYGLCNDLLEELCEQKRRNKDCLDAKAFEERKKFLELLLNKYTKKLDLCGILSFCPKDMFLESLKQMIRAIAASAPNLQELTIERCIVSLKMLSVESEKGYEGFGVSETLESKIACLSKLKSLKCGTNNKLLFRDFSQLASLCSKLPDLQKVNASFDQSGDSLVEDALLERCFPSLISYDFSMVCNKRELKQTFNHHLDQICSSNAKALKYCYVSKTRISGSESFRRTYYTGSLGRFRKVLMEAGHCERFIEGVNVKKNFSGNYFRDIFGCKNENFVPAASAASLESVPVSSFRYILRGNENYSKILEHVEKIGMDLHTLIIESDRTFAALQSLDLAKTLELCPKLEKLEFGRRCVQFDEQKSLAQFTQLRELDCSSLIFSFKELAKVLSAPNLERVSFDVCNASIKTDDLKRLVSFIADGVILKKLRSLDITLTLCLTMDTLSDIGKINKFLMAASAFLPNLSNLRYFIVAIERCSMSLVTFQVGNNEMLSNFFQNCYSFKSQSFASYCAAILEYLESSNINKFMSLY